MFSKAPIRRFHEQNVSCAPPPNKYDPKLPGGGSGAPKLGGGGERFKDECSSQGRPSSSRSLRRRSLSGSSISSAKSGSSARSLINDPAFKRPKSPSTTAEIEELRSQLNGVRDEFSDLERQRCVLLNDVQELREQLDRVIEERDRWSSTVETLTESQEKALQEWETEKETLIIKLEKAEEMLRMKGEEMDGLMGEYAKLEEDNRGLHDQLAHVKVTHDNEIRRMSVECDTLKVTVDSMKRHVLDLERTIEMTQGEMALKNEMWNNERSSLVQQVTSLTEKSTSLITQLETLTQTKVELEFSLKVHKDHLEESEEAKNRLVSQFNQQRDELVAQLTECQSRCAELESAKNELSTKLVSLEQDCGQYKMDIEESASRIIFLETEIRKSEQQREQIQYDFDALSGELGASSEQLSHLKRQLEQLSSKMEQLQGNYSAEMEKAADLTKQKESLQEQLEEKRQSLLKRDLELKEAHAMFEDECNQFKTSINALEERSVALENEKGKLEKDLLEKQQQLEDAVESSQNLSQDLNAKVAMIASLENQLDEIRAENDLVLQQSVHLKDSVYNLEKQIAAFEKDRDDLVARLESTESLVYSLKEEKGKAEYELETLREENARLDKERVEELAKTEQTILDLMQRIQNSEEHQSDLLNQISKLQTELNNSETQRSRLSGERAEILHKYQQQEQLLHSNAQQIAQFEETVKLIQTEKVQLAENLEQRDATVDELLNEKEMLLKEKDSIERQLSATQNMLEQLEISASAVEAKNAALQGELQVAVDRVDTLTRTLEVTLEERQEADDQLKTALNELDAKAREIVTLQEERENFVRDNESLKTELDAAQIQYAANMEDLKTKLNEVMEASEHRQQLVTDLEARIIEVTSQIKQLEDEKKNSDDELQQVLEALESMKDVNAILKEEKELLALEVDKAKEVELQLRQQMEQRDNSFLDQIAELKLHESAKEKEFSSKFADYTSYVHFLQGQNADLRNAEKNIKRELDQKYQEDITRLTAEKNTLLEQQMSLSEVLNSLSRDKVRLESNRHLSDLEFNTLYDQLSRMVGHQNERQKIHYVGNMVRERGQMREELIQLRTREQQLLNKVKRLESQLLIASKKSSSKQPYESITTDPLKENRPYYV